MRCASTSARASARRRPGSMQTFRGWQRRRRTLSALPRDPCPRSATTPQPSRGSACPRRCCSCATRTAAPTRPRPWRWRTSCWACTCSPRRRCVYEPQAAGFPSPHAKRGGEGSGGGGLEPVTSGANKKPPPRLRPLSRASPPSPPLASLAGGGISPPEQPHHKREHDTDQHAGDDRKVEVRVAALDHHVAGQPAEAE